MPSTASAPSPALHERLLARLRLRHLRLVDALATHSNLRRAAEATHMSQPAATQMLRELEALLEMPLFERHARGMRITDAGRLLAAHARMAIDSLRIATEDLCALAAQAARPVRIGALDAALVSVLQPAMPRLLAQHPQLRLVIEDGTGERLGAGLRGGAFDLVLLRQPARLEPGHRFIPLRSDRMVVIAGISHPAAKRRRLRLRDLADSRWILPPPHFAVRQALDAAWAQEKMVPREHPVQTLSPHLLRTLLAQPDVVMPVPHTSLDRLDRREVVQLPLQLDAPIEPLGLLYRPDDAGAAVQLLIDFLIEQAQGT
ncbi:LysR family transcriptional regulator [Variovorax sp. OV329]|uniref:LysR family transcriptional regulator n=1 Tax=Variovorax sp. OV329 TaxID=1882825 RepID=UPI0008F2D8FE|nr:LysR substrate-binding domain-containing protein [Variovorax sp. OV329]SFM98574.1 DNA-binding transcriptional regulator, LysR family [Variovorax sp. OV329]